MERETILNVPKVCHKANEITKKVKTIWTNNFPLKMTKEIKFVQFDVKFTPSISEENTNLKKLVFNKAFHFKTLNVFTGNSLFIKKDETIIDLINEYKEVNFRDVQYKVEIYLTTNEVSIGPNTKSLSPEQSMILNIIIKNIFAKNPKTELIKDVLIDKTKFVTLSTTRSKINIDFSQDMPSQLLI